MPSRRKFPSGDMAVREVWEGPPSLGPSADYTGEQAITWYASIKKKQIKLQKKRHNLVQKRLWSRYPVRQPFPNRVPLEVLRYLELWLIDFVGAWIVPGSPLGRASSMTLKIFIYICRDGTLISTVEILHCKRWESLPTDPHPPLKERQSSPILQMSRNRVPGNEYLYCH